MKKKAFIIAFVFACALIFSYSAFAFVGIGSSPVWVSTNQGHITGGGIPAGAMLWESSGDIVTWGDGNSINWE